MNETDATVAITSGGASVSLTAQVFADGSVSCQLSVGSQKLSAIFNGTDILVDVPN